MDKQISVGIIFLTPVKKIWDTLKETYEHKKNIFLVYELYKQFFSLQQGDRTVIDLYTSLQVVMDELKMYQSIVPND